MEIWPQIAYGCYNVIYLRVSVCDTDFTCTLLKFGHKIVALCLWSGLGPQSDTAITFDPIIDHISERCGQSQIKLGVGMEHDRFK